MRNPMQIFESQVIAMCCRLLVATILAAASPSQQEKAPSETDLSGWWRGAMAASGKGSQAGEQRLDLLVELRTLDTRPEARIHLPALGLFDLPLTRGRVAAGAIDLAGQPLGPVRVRAKLLGNKVLSGRLDRGSRTDKFELRRIAPPWPRVSEVPFSFRGSGDLQLNGTLLLPTGDGPHPAIVWVHGSGNAGLRQNAIYRSPAYYLATKGVAALLYDKRGWGASSGRRDWDFYELADDASAARSWLAKRKEVDPKRIGIGGISQAGWVAPLAATKNPGFGFVVALSASGGTIANQNVYSLKGLLTRDGMTPDRIGAITGALHRSNEYYRTLANKREVEAELSELRTKPWFQSHGYLPTPPLGPKGKVEIATMFLDPLRLWQDLKVPVIAVWGDRDTIVEPGRSKAAVEEAVRPDVRARSQFRMLLGADHVMGLASDGQVSGWAPVHPELLPLLEQWVIATTRFR